MRHGEHTYRTLLRKLWRPAGKCSGTRKGCQVERELICTYNHQINRRQATSSWVLSIAQTCVPSARKRYASRSTCALAATAACVPARSPCPPWSTLPISTAPLFPMISPHMWHASQMNASCVAPVCPVDNHRDLLMLSLKQRLGVSWDGTVDMDRVLNFLPPGWDLSLLLSRLREQPMFSDPQLVLDNYLLHFVATSKIFS